ncbi:hypothetical protein, partial [Desulfosporosinus sp. BG]|uniref:hypothetical protein n=1 Tax=Desulfosporosinus sp. BG TaxID=1633135 RepID=UPI00159F237D
GIAASAILYPTPVRIPRGITASAILSTGDYRTGDYRTKSAILGALAAAHILVRCPVSGVGRLNGSLLGCLRKDVALCHTASRAWGRGRRGDGDEETECGWTAHFMCTVWLKKDGTACTMSSRKYLGSVA